MTLGRNSRTSSVRSSLRAPKFLDKSSGFYGRLDEPESANEEKRVESGEVLENKEKRTSTSSTVDDSSKTDDGEDAEVFGLNEGMMEGDGETLLHRKPSRLSSRWRRSSRRKQKEEEDTAHGDAMGKIQLEERDGGKEVVHFRVGEEADDQVLIRDKKRGREEEGEKEEKMETREQEDGMKTAKRKSYKKALDRAFRRGWEAFITNLYSVTLTPSTSSTPASPTSNKKMQHSSALAELR